jgi:hypothetical protein
LMGGGDAGGGKHSSAESERERKDGVLPLDHFKGDAQVVKYGHEKIVEQKQLPIASIQLSVLGPGFDWKSSVCVLDGAGGDRISATEPGIVSQ